MSIHPRLLLAAVLTAAGVAAAIPMSALAGETRSRADATAAPLAGAGPRTGPLLAATRGPTAPVTRRVTRPPKSKPRARRPTRRSAPRRATGLRLAYSGRPVITKGPSIEGVMAIGNTARLNAGMWTNAERYWIDLYRWKSSTGWVFIGSYDRGSLKTLSVYLGNDWGDSYIGFYSWAYNSWYGWSDPAWSEVEYPHFDGIVQVGNTVNLNVGAWSGADRYWIEVWRWTSATGWQVVTSRYLDTARSMALYLGSDWRNSWIGFYGWGYNAAFGWSYPEWSEGVFVQPENAGQSFDRIDTPGVVRNESGAWGWWLSNDFHANVAHYFRFQSCCSTPLVGDWDGDGVDTQGVNIGGNRWILGNGYDGVADYDFYYGNPGDVPLVGDWDGDGDDTIAIRRDHCFYWKNSFAGGSADNVTCFGNPSDKPVVGDWDGNGTDTPGVYRNGEWWLNNDFSGTVHHFLRYGGAAGDRPIPGDFDGDGDDTPGIHNWNAFHLSNDLAGTTHYSLIYGNPGDIGVVGDWDSEPTDSYAETDVTVSSFALQDGMALMAAPDYVTRYAPRLVFHPNEGFFPMRAASFIANSSLRWYFDDALSVPIQGAGRGRIKVARLGRSKTPYEARTRRGVIKRKGSRPYIATDCTRPHEPASHCPDRPSLGGEEGFALDFQGSEEAARGTRIPTGIVHAYYEYQAQRYITYWFFYARSRGVLNIDHEGDWERIAIKLDANNQPTRVALYRHQCEVTYPWRVAQKWNASTGQVDANGTHPVVFVAQFTHGTYLSTSPLQCEERFGQPLDEVQGGGATWNTWRLLANTRSQGWYGFGGAWGSVGDREYTTGPLGPSQYKHPKPRAW
jgi:hypothetical protein